MLTANKKITKDIEIGLLLGQNYWSSRVTRLGVQGYNYTLDNLYDFSAIDQSVPQNLQISPISRNSYREIAAYYADAKINFREYLFVNFTGRSEQASTLPRSKNRYFHPTISTSFVFSDALNLTNGKYFSYGKLRAAWAQVGNLPNPYLTNNYYGPVAGGAFAGQNLYAINAELGNPNFRPEVSVSREIGIELRFFKNRVNVDFTYYNNINKDLIIVADRAPSAGFTSAWLNGGKLRNTGYEVILGGTPVKKQIVWDVSVNFTRQRTQVEELVGGFQYVGGGAAFNNGSNAAIPGYQYGVIVSPSRIKRYWQDANDLTIRRDLPMVVDSAGMPIIESSPKGYYIIGNPNPKWLAGIRNSLTYKGWYVSMLWDIRRGGDLINLTRGSMNFFGQHKDTENRDQAQVLENLVY